MAGIEANIIKEMVDQIEGFKKIIKEAGEEGRNKLESIKLDEVLNEVLGPDRKFDSKKWSDLKEDQQKKVHDRLNLVRDALHSASELDGPADPKHIMYVEYASNTTIVIWTLLGFLLIAFLLGAIVPRWDQATGYKRETPAGKGEQKDIQGQDQGAAAKQSEAVAPQIKTEKEGAPEKVEGIAKEAAKAKEAASKTKIQSASAKDEKTLKQSQKTTQEQDQGAAVKQSEATTKEDKTGKEAGHEKPKKPPGKKDEPLSEGSVLTMVILLGALGGSLHLVSSLVMFIGNRQLKRSWLPYYLAMPFTGAGLAPVVYMLLRVGLITPAGTATGGTGLSGLNFIAIYAFAVMTGMFSRSALDKLGEVFDTIFKTQAPPSKDALGPKKPPSSSTPDAVKSP